MKAKTTGVCLVLGLLSFAFAGEPVVIGDKLTVKSHILSEDRAVQVYLPQSYSSGNSGYPVLYQMDGDYNFHHTTGLIAYYAEIGVIPEMIVVGVSAKQQPIYIKNLTPPHKKPDQSGRGDAFLRFMTEELAPKIEGTYRTQPYRMLLGHSVGGLFVVNSFLDNPRSFNGFLAISPSLWWDRYATNKRAAEILKDNGDMANRALYLSLANEQRMGVKPFASILEKNARSGLAWGFRQFEEENHNSVSVPAIIWSLKQLFKGWEVGRGNIGGFKDFKEISVHYQAFSKKMGYKVKLPYMTIYVAASTYLQRKKEDQIEVMRTEIDQHFPDSKSDFLIYTGMIYSKKEKHEKALAMLQEHTRLYPQSANGFNTLGNAYEAAGDLEKAGASFQKAAELGKAHGDRDAYIYASNHQRLQK